MGALSLEDTGAIDRGAAGLATGDDEDWSFEGSDDPGFSDDPDPTEEGAGVDWDDVQCTYEGFPVLIHQATQDNRDPSHPTFLYQARDTEWEPFDELRILSYQSEPYYGPTGPGSYALEGSNYGDCGLCLLVVTGCDEEYSCESVHFADQGTLVISDLSRTGGPFAARLQQVVFRQVEIDPDTLRSTPVDDGVSWCIDELEIDLPSMALN